MRVFPRIPATGRKPRSHSPDKSPFVELFVLAGLPAAAGVVNFVVMTSAASSSNSGIFSTSRMLYGLAQEGDAPRNFATLSPRAVPARGLVFSCICLLGGVVLIYAVPSIITASTLVTTISSICFMFVWAIILFSYMAYRKNRPGLHARSIYKMPGGVTMCWACLVFFIFVLALFSFKEDTRIALCVTPVWFIILGIGYHFSKTARRAKSAA